jgi:hypothetical protein
VFVCDLDDAAFRGESWIIATHCMAGGQARGATVQQCAAVQRAVQRGLRPLAKGARIPGKDSDGFGMGVRHAAGRLTFSPWPRGVSVFVFVDFDLGVVIACLLFSCVPRCETERACRWRRQ